MLLYNRFIFVSVVSFIKMLSIKPFQIKNKPFHNMLFYSADELKTSFPNFFIGTSKTVRLIINKKNIPTTEYIYANKIKNDEWNISDASSKKAKLLLTKSWVDQHIISETILEPEQKYKISPNKIKLEDNEKFRDVNGKVIEIETLGERHHDKIYFSVHDISVGFDMPNLNQIITHKEKGYEKEKHYELFVRNELTNGQPVPNILNKTDKNTRKLYLTYLGLTRLLFVSKNKNAEYFQKWAIEKLFTIQMGNENEKERLATNLLQINLESFRAVFKKHANKFPCIYLLALGTVGELRETFNISGEIDDKMIVYKYGFSDDMDRRLKEHNNDYGKLQNVNISVSLFHIIDTKYTSEAEDDLRQFFKNMNKTLFVENQQQNRKELVVLNTKELETVKKEFRHIGNDYAGNTQELQKQILDLNTKIEKQELQHKIEKQELHHKIKDMQNMHEIEILKKEMIIQQQKSKLEYNELLLGTKVIS
jgi:hypothetical protein